MRLSKLLSYIVELVYQPRAALADLVGDPAVAAYGVVGLTLLGLLYAFTTYVGYRRGFGAVATPWLNIAPERYYLYETFFGTPVFLVVAVVFAGVARLVAEALGGSGSFEQLVGVYCLTSVAPMFLTLWVPETTLIVLFPDSRAKPLGGFGKLPTWIDVARQLVSIGWPLVLIVIGVSLAEGLPTGAAAVTALAGTVPSVALMLVFIR